MVIENRMQHDEWVPILEFMTKGCAPTTMNSVAMDANEEWVAHSREVSSISFSFVLLAIFAILIIDFTILLCG